MIIAQVELLLTYIERFYHRQFLTRKIANHKILNRLESILTEYFNSESLTKKGLPTVQFIAETLNVSASYLSELLKVLTGQTTQQHIHARLIDKAKQLLLSTSLTVNETAFQLGFDYPHYFSRLFKNKTGLTPAAFRFSAQ